MCWAQQGASVRLLLAETELDHSYQLNALRVVDAATRNKSTPLADGKPLIHVLSIACGKNGKVLLYRENSGHGTVSEWQADAEWKIWKPLRLWKIPEGSYVTSLVAGKPAMLAIRRAMSTAFYEWGEGEPRKVAELAGHFYRLTAPLPSGEFPAITDLSGREEVWAVHPARKSARRLISVLGGINSYARRDDRWWVSSYRHGGYDIAEATPVSEEPRALSSQTPAPVEPTTAVRASAPRSYSGWSTLRPRAWIPSMLIVPSGLQISAWIPGFDVSQKHVYNLFGGYDTRGSPFLLADYSYRFGETQQLLAQINYVPSYLISSSTFLKQWGASLGWGARLGRDAPFLSV
jgi:hypothetical protein